MHLEPLDFFVNVYSCLTFDPFHILFIYTDMNDSPLGNHKIEGIWKKSYNPVTEAGKLAFGFT